MNQNNKSTIKTNTLSVSNKNINHNTAQDINKKKSRKKCTCTGRDTKIEPDLYYKIKEENELLKKNKISQDEKIKNLEVSLANIKESIIRERRLADYKVINNKDINSDLEKTKYENQKLKFENEKKNLIIKGLQSNALITRAKQKSKNKKKCKSKDPKNYQMSKNDNIATINYLREQLKIANEDRRTLISELRNRQLANSNPNTYNININNSLKNKINELNSDFDDATMKLDTKNKVLEITKNKLDLYIEKFENERDNNRKMQAELSMLKGQEEKIQQYKNLIEDLKNNEKKLEEELNDLRINPFIKEVEERGNVFRNYQITEKRLQDTKKLLDEKEKELQENEFKLKELEKENKKLKDNNIKLEVEKEKLKEEYLKL